jgi:hypothetical protein
MKIRTIKDKQYYGPIVFKTLERDEFNRPSKVEIGYDDTTFHLKGGEAFFIGYISVTAVEDAISPKVKS